MDRGFTTTLLGFHADHTVHCTLYCKSDMKMEFLHCSNKLKDFLTMFKADKVEINNENQKV